MQPKKYSIKLIDSVTGKIVFRKKSFLPYELLLLEAVGAIRQKGWDSISISDLPLEYETDFFSANYLIPRVLANIKSLMGEERLNDFIKNNPLKKEIENAK